MKHHLQRGFTLIELMIVIAIIGVLSAIALPMYQDYIARSQMTRVHYELSSTKTAIEFIISEGALPTLLPSEDGQTIDGKRREYIGLNQDNPQSNLIYNLSVVNNDDGTKINASMNHNAAANIKDVVFSYTRQPDGVWICEINKSSAQFWKESYGPRGCLQI